MSNFFGESFLFNRLPFNSKYFIIYIVAVFRQQWIEKSENRDWQKQQQHSKREYEYQDYKVEDDILAKWMENAKKQAVDLAIQTIKDFKGVTKAAANGCMNGIIQLVIWVVVINLIFLLVRACNN